MLPLNQWNGISVAVLVGGLILIGAVVALEVRAIVDAPFPRLRGFETLLAGIPLVLGGFAAKVDLTSSAQPAVSVNP